MVTMSSANGSSRKGTRASSRIVTIVAWLTCWYMSMSDQRTCTGAVNPSDPSRCALGHPDVPVPLVLVMLRIWRAATDSVARSCSPSS